MQNNINLLKQQLILDALSNANRVIDEVYRDQETGETDRSFENNKELYDLYHHINDMCLEITNNNNFWWNK